MKNKSKKFNFLLLILVLIGVFLLILGIQRTIQYNVQTKNYMEIQATYIDLIEHERIDEDGFHVTYELIYSYEVNGKDYQIHTDYSLGKTPKEGQQKIVLYNPDNPEEAMLKGNSNGILLIVFSIMFLLPSIIFVLENFIKFKKKKIKNALNNILGGSIFLFVGVGLYIWAGSIYDDYSLLSVIENIGLPPTIIFIIFPIAGCMIIIPAIYDIIKTLKRTKK